MAAQELPYKRQRIAGKYEDLKVPCLLRGEICDDVSNNLQRPADKYPTVKQGYTMHALSEYIFFYMEISIVQEKIKKKHTDSSKHSHVQSRRHNAHRTQQSP